jgi:hypothetical protein
LAVEIALKKATVPWLSIVYGVTAATLAVFLTSVWSVTRRGSCARGSLLLDDEEELELPELELLELELPELELPDGACAGVPSLTAISSGPLTPGPKYWEIRS